MPTLRRFAARTIRATPIAVCAAIAFAQPAAAQTPTPHAAAVPTARAGAPATADSRLTQTEALAPEARPAFPARTHAANRSRAVGAAKALVAHTPAPATARRLTAEPAGDGRLLAHPRGGPASRAVIDRHAFFIVRKPVRAMRRYYARHRPAAARQIGTRADNGSGVPANLDVTWQWHPGARGIVSRQTMIDIVALPSGVPSGATGIRIDALVIYRVPQPAGEKVPAGITEVDIARAAPGQMPDLSRTVKWPRFATATSVPVG